MTTPQSFRPRCEAEAAEYIEGDTEKAVLAREAFCERLSSIWPYHYDGVSHGKLDAFLSRAIRWMAVAEELAGEAEPGAEVDPR